MHYEHGDEIGHQRRASAVAGHGEFESRDRCSIAVILEQIDPIGRAIARIDFDAPGSA
jgi:hypothetical protein